MSLHTFDVTEFREQFPQFANPVEFPDALLQGYWDAAICYINPHDYGYLTGDCLQRALNLMTAHLAALAVLIADGQNPGFAESATIDKVSVTLQPPPVKNQFTWWLSTTPYGAQLLALLGVKGVGGFYIGGLPEQSAILKVGGFYSGNSGLN